LLNFSILPLMNFPSLGDEVRNGPGGEAQLFHQLRATCFAAPFRQIAVKGPCPGDLPNSAATQNISLHTAGNDMIETSRNVDPCLSWHAASITNIKKLSNVLYPFPVKCLHYYFKSYDYPFNHIVNSSPSPHKSKNDLLLLGRRQRFYLCFSD